MKKVKEPEVNETIEACLQRVSADLEKLKRAVYRDIKMLALRRPQDFAVRIDWLATQNQHKASLISNLIQNVSGTISTVENQWIEREPANDGSDTPF